VQKVQGGERRRSNHGGGETGELESGIGGLVRDDHGRELVRLEGRDVLVACVGSVEGPAVVDLAGAAGQGLGFALAEIDRQLVSVVREHQVQVDAPIQIAKPGVLEMVGSRCEGDHGLHRDSLLLRERLYLRGVIEPRPASLLDDLEAVIGGGRCIDRGNVAAKQIAISESKQQERSGDAGGDRHPPARAAGLTGWHAFPRFGGDLQAHAAIYCFGVNIL
jgi:hypothetical protein